MNSRHSCGGRRMTTKLSKAQEQFSFFLCAFTTIGISVIEDESNFVIGAACSAIAAGIGYRN